MNHKHYHNEDNDLFSMPRAANILGVGRNKFFAEFRHLGIIEESLKTSPIIISLKMNISNA